MMLRDDARAAEAAAGGAALEQARAAWNRGALGSAEPLYREALEKGGLSPTETLEGYVRLGSIRSTSNKKDPAVAAFRAASVLDSSFTVPSEAGARGHRFADRAKRDTAKIGSIQLALRVPKEVEAGKAFKVTATLDKAHLAIVNRLAVTAKDGTTGKDVVVDAKPDESVEFEISGDLTLPKASIVVRLDALDSHANRLATSEDRVRVPDREAAGAAPASVAAAARPASAAPFVAYRPPGSDSDTRRGGGFWSSPWPYVIGGIALVGAGTAVFFGTRPADKVSVGAVDVR